MRIAVDAHACIGSGQCVLAAPDVFDQRPDDGVAVVLLREPPEGLRDTVRRAVSSCPVDAISMVE